MIYISTDYVFSGINGPFNEASHPMPATQYGKDKLAVENFVIKTLSNYAIIRTAGIFGLKNDFVETVIGVLNQGSVFCAYTNLKNNPTFIKDLSSMLRVVIIKRHIGTFCCAGSESVSRYDFAVKVKKVFRFEKSLIVPTKLDLSNDVRPPDLSMDCSRTYKILGYYPEGIESILQSHNNIWRERLFSGGSSK